MVTSKQLLLAYNKPIIHCSLLKIMLAEIKDILIISNLTDSSRFKALLGNGSQFGVSFQYCVQSCLDGLAQASILVEEFIGDDGYAMILGDNNFYENSFRALVKATAKNAEENNRATVFVSPPGEADPADDCQLSE